MSGSIGGVGQNQYIGNLDQTGDINKIGSQDTTGTGNIGQNGPVPGTGSDPSYGAILGSLQKFMPQLTGQVLEVMLLEITTKMKELQEASEKDKVRVDQEAKRTALAEKHDKLKEAEKKILEAIEKRDSASIWDKIKLGFQIFAAVAAIVAGIALAATGAGAAVAAPLIAIGVMGLVMAVDSIVRMETGMGIAGHVAKAAGANPEQIAQAEMGFGIAMAGIAVITSIAAFFIPGGQLGATASMIQAVSTITSAVIGIATAAGDVTAGIIKYDAAKMQAEGQKLQAETKEMEAWLQQLDEFIDQALQRLIGASDRFNAMLDGLMEAIQDTAKTTAKAKFTG